MTYVTSWVVALVVGQVQAPPVSFEKSIEPILANKCAVCHSGSVTRGKLDMGSFASFAKGGKSGAPFVPGKSSESLIIKLVSKSQKPFMPPKDETPLTSEELALLTKWIDQGAKAPSSARKDTIKLALRELPASVKPVRGLAISPDQRLMAVGRGQHLAIYELATAKQVQAIVEPAPIEAVAFSPNGGTLAVATFQQVSIWDPQTGKSIRKLMGFRERVMSVTFSPDGKLLAAVGGAPTEEGEIKVFEAATGKLAFEIANGHSDTVYGASFRPDGTKLATCSADKYVRVFGLPAGQLLKTFEGHTNYVLDVAWRLDGKQLVSAGADNVLKVWDFEKGEQVRTVGAQHTKQVTRLAFRGKTAEILAGSGDRSVRFWNVDNGAAGTAFSGSKDFVQAVCVSADGKQVAIGGEEGIVRLYNGANGQLVKEIPPTSK